MIVYPASYKSGVGLGDVMTSHFEATARVAAWDYSAQDGVDATNRRFAGSLIPVRDRTTAWIISYRIQELDLAGQTALASHAALAGVRRRHFANLASEWAAGVAEVDYGTGGSTVRNFAFVAKAAAGAPGTPATAELSLERETATVMAATVRRLLAFGTLTAQWETRLESEGGNTTHPILARRVSIGFADTLVSGTALSAKGSYGWSTPFHASGSRAEIYRADLFMSTPIEPWVTGRIGYTFVRQSNPDRPLPLDFRRGRFFVSLTTAFQ